MNKLSTHRMRFGAEIQQEGSVRFRLFAPGSSSVQLKFGDDEPAEEMPSPEPGWFECISAKASAGTLYSFLLADGTQVPDPAARYQPQDVHGPSEVIAPNSFTWSDEHWAGRPWEQVVLYELHVGTFTPEGTFHSAVPKLDHLVQLGITAIELMCVTDFAGNRNWGYDGVLLYAPDSAYGRPEDMKAFIDAAHQRGLMVILDVVYNHFGPEGNYLTKYFPQILSDRHTTPWGCGLNFDSAGNREVREFIVENALYWVEEFHVDGLRIDASHAMIDDSPRHVLDELRDRVEAAAPDRTIHLILENESSIAERLKRDSNGAPENYSAQWNHDITHLLAAILGKSCQERRSDDAGETQKLGEALSHGFVIAAEESHTHISSRVPPTAYISFIQTHDLVGNRIFGDRITSAAAAVRVKAIAAIYLLLPQIPMLFMGEEWAASAPFPFFCDYHGPLADEVRKGRCDQLSRQDPAPSEEEMQRAPDPQAESTLRSAQLHWDELQSEPHAGWLRWYRKLLQVRRDSVVPLLPGIHGRCGSYEVLGPGALKATWDLAGAAKLHLAANLCDEETRGFGPACGDVIWTEGSEQDGVLGGWSVQWSVERSEQPQQARED
jgi:malto-oligosyltrehalose trehalohydrolase